MKAPKAPKPTAQELAGVARQSRMRALSEARSKAIGRAFLKAFKTPLASAATPCRQ